MKKITMVLVLVLMSSAGLMAQDYYSSLINDMMGGSYKKPGSTHGEATLEAFSLKDNDIESDIDQLFYRVGIDFTMGKQARQDTWNIGGAYTGGSSEIDGSTLEYDYHAELHGGWYFQKNISVNGAMGYGTYETENDEGDISHYSLGAEFMQPGNIFSGVTIDWGSIGEGDLLKDFEGIEFNAYEIKDIYWLKWYLGSVDDRDYIRTDICMPIHVDKEYGGYAFLLRYVVVNSHSDSGASYPLPAVSVPMSDWTEHQEWWISVIFGMDRKKSDWFFKADYGLYRTREFTKHNDSEMFRLKLKYIF